MSLILRTIFEGTIKKQQKKIEILNKRNRDFGLWKQDKNQAIALSKEIFFLQEQIDNLQSINRENQDLIEIINLIEQTNDFSLIKEIKKRIVLIEEKIRQQKNFNLSDEKNFVKRNVVLSIYAGVGGKDAEDWVAILLRMYQRYCEKQGFENKVIDIVFGEGRCENRQGVKTVVLKIKKNYLKDKQNQHPWQCLKNEKGIHRLVRQSPFSSQNLRHTSFAQVEIIPDMAEEARRKIKIIPNDIKIDVFCSSGPGGQNVNKRETAVRLTHLPTNLKVVCQSERTQLLNKKQAMDILYSKLYQVYQQQEKENIKKMKNNKTFVHWGSQIRSYVMHPYQIVKDHRYNLETTRINDVLNGDLSLIQK